MEIIYLLIPVSAVLVIVIVAGFLWAARSGQFDDLERRGRDILHDDDGPSSTHDK
ncbi:MAG: cbb3-type cytochrome oxidase assembly protein CcoS [Proteobacteria bacterium]|nr:cbb3-type cytochrome oxidase assembly protein CcoS [Pseudomonadota bacterium]MBK8957437.1 cbb3-type cytochrome oxidase assembly protein CcoS [Pseudomonadota bacterium]